MRGDATRARRELYEAMDGTEPFDQRAARALDVGKGYLGVSHAHLTHVDPDADFWQAVASTDEPTGAFPTGLVLQLSRTYCRHTADRGASLALHDAPEQGYADDPAYRDSGARCYHGTPIRIEGELYGTVCFVDENPRDPFSEEETTFAELLARVLEHELRQERVEAKLARLDRFASVVSHDLRSPLNVAQGHLDLARADGDSDHLQTTAEALDQMERIIDDVLTMAREGGEVTDPELLSLGEITEDCWSEIDAPDATLSIVEDVKIRGDPKQIRRLVANLLRNAVDHGGGDVTIRVGGLPDEAGFYVEDDGVGIPEESRPDVFESGHSTGGDGIGLGLSIVQTVADAHDWSVILTESADGGARFEFSDVVVQQ